MRSTADKIRQQDEAAEQVKTPQVITNVITLSFLKSKHNPSLTNNLTHSTGRLSGGDS